MRATVADAPTGLADQRRRRTLAALTEHAVALPIAPAVHRVSQLATRIAYSPAAFYALPKTAAKTAMRTYMPLRICLK